MSKQWAPRPRAARSGKQIKPEAAGAREEVGRGKKRGTTTKKKHGQTQPRGARTKRKDETAKRKGEAHQNAPGRPARPTRPRRACTVTHAWDPGVASSDPKGEVLASTRNSPAAPAESPVERRTVQEPGRVSDRVHTSHTTAAHAAQDRSRRDPPGTTPSRGSERVQRGASPAPLPRPGPAAGTMSPVLGRHTRAPRSRPVNPETTATGLSEGTTATGKPTKAARATGPDVARRTNTGPGGKPERHAASQKQGHKDTCEATTATGCRKPRKRAQQTTNRGTGEGGKGNGAPTLADRTHNLWVAGPGRPLREGGGAWESAQPRTPHTQARDTPPPRCALVLPPQRAKPARKSARRGVADGSPRPQPPHPQPVGIGPRPHGQMTRSRAWESAPTRTPHTQARDASPPLGARVPLRCPAKAAHKSARCGFGDGSPRQRTPHPRPVGSGPRLHAPRTGGRAWESAEPRTPHTRTRGAPPPRAPLCCPKSASSRLARERPVGSVTGPHAHSPRTHSQWVPGPGRKPEEWAVGRGSTFNPGRSTPSQEAPPPPGRPRAAPQRAKRARKSAGCGGGDGSPHPHPPHPQPVGSRPQPHAPRAGGWAWKSAQPGTPHTQARGAPALGRPCAAPKSAKPARKGRPTRRGGSSLKPGEGPQGPRHPLARAKKAEHGTWAANAEGHEPPGTALPAPCTTTAHSAGATPTLGGEARTPREHERTHTQRTRGADPKGNRTEPVERTDRMEWGTGR